MLLQEQFAQETFAKILHYFNIITSAVTLPFVDIIDAGIGDLDKPFYQMMQNGDKSHWHLVTA